MSPEKDIRKASDKFYAALNSILNGDWSPMADVWSRRPEVSAKHPPGGTQVGWDEIRASWENLAKICSKGRVELREQRISVGEDLAYETSIGACECYDCERPSSGRSSDIQRFPPRRQRVKDGSPTTLISISRCWQI